MSSFGRRIRALARTALFWSVGWGAAAVILLYVMRVAGEVPASIGSLDIIGMSVKVAFWGGIVGSLFSAAIGLAFRGRRVADLRISRFTLLGAAAGGVGIPALLTLFNWIGGEPAVPWSLLQDDAVLGTMFGGALAAGSLWMAQRAERRAAAAEAPSSLRREATPRFAPTAASPVTVAHHPESVAVCDPRP
jgi:hypothetical protein